MPTTVVFDINETTLDLAPVRAVVDDIVGAEGGFTVWFQRLLQLSMTVTATDAYTDFSTLAPAALHAVAATGGRTLADDAWAPAGAAMASLDPYPDVAEGLQRLRGNGHQTIALTNSAPASVSAQLERAGLTPLFDHILSVDAVKRFKPGAAPYRHAAEVAQTEPSAMWMVACHDWDLAGAKAVGLSTAFVTRPAMSFATPLPPADLTVADFVELAEHLG